MFERASSLLRRLVGKTPVPQSKTATSELDRRLWIRYATDVATNIQVAGNGQETRLPARVKDISLGGANLVLDRAFPPGQLLSLELPREGGQETQTVLACVVRVRAEDSGEWAVGCV